MKFPYKKAIVTGGAGFIGSHIVEALLKHDIEVISVDNYVGGKEENIALFKKNKKFTDIHGDVADREHMKQLMPGVDIIFHNAASKKNVCITDPNRDLMTNALGTLTLLQLSQEYGVKKFVHASTGSVYGEAVVLPQSEDHPLRPRSYYGVSKLAGERYVDVFNSLHSLNTTILRYFHVYGPRQESSDYGGVIAIFNRNIMAGKQPIIFGDGTQERSFTHVHDVVQANMLAATKPESEGEVYNVASGIKITINDTARMLLHFHGSMLEPIYDDWLVGDIRKFDVKNTKLKSLGLKSFIPFEKGLQDTAKWYKKYFSGSPSTK
ncbi:MAG: SDR family NAD(P)-dependent oxidoreductase [Nanoarchaeota archaeon]